MQIEPGENHATVHCPLDPLPLIPRLHLSPTAAVATEDVVAGAAATGIVAIWTVVGVGTSMMNEIVLGADLRKVDGVATEMTGTATDISILMSGPGILERTAILATCAIGMLDPSSTAKAQSHTTRLRPQKTSRRHR